MEPHVHLEALKLSNLPNNSQLWAWVAFQPTYKSRNTILDSEPRLISKNLLGLGDVCESLSHVAWLSRKHFCLCS